MLCAFGPERAFAPAPAIATDYQNGRSRFHRFAICSLGSAGACRNANAEDYYGKTRNNEETAQR
jgi:hypothetical protein